MTSILVAVSFGYLGKTVEAANEQIPPKNVILSDIFTTTRHSTMITDSIVQLTPDAQNREGAIWSTDNNLMNLREDFSSVMHLYFGNRGGNAGDGMAFVMQNSPERQNAYSYSGASLGVWATQKEGATHGGIKNSFAVEFDTYYNNNKNDSRFDNQLNVLGQANHVANAFPGRPAIWDDWSATYIDWYAGWGDGNQRTLNHNNIQLPGPLSNDQWHRFAVDWSAETSTLTYQFANLSPVKVPINVLADFGSYDLVWGFTGSTGTKSQMNRVVFEKVPGVVNASSSVTVARAGKILEPGSPVYSGEELTFQLDATYLSGKQNWLDVAADFTLSDDFDLIPGTTKKIHPKTGEEFPIEDHDWQENHLITRIGDLSPALNQKQVVFKATVTPALPGSHSVGHQVNFSGNNHLLTSEGYSLTIEGNRPPEISISSPENEIRLDNETTVIEGLWRDDGDSLTLFSLLNGQVYHQAPLHSANGNTWQLEFPAGALAVGSNQLVVYLVDNQGAGSNQASLTFNVASPPRLSLADTALNQDVIFSDPFDLTGTWMDKDSPFVQLYYTINNGPERLATDEIENSNLGSQTDLLAIIMSHDLKMGENQLVFFLKDSEGFFSNKVSTLITVTGALEFSFISPMVSFESLAIPHGVAYSKRQNNWTIAVRDTRNTQSNWRVQAILKDSPVPKGKYSLENRLVYLNQHEEIPLEINSPVDVFSHQTTTTESVPVSWQEDQGLLFKANSSMYAGDYVGEIGWRVVDAP